MEYEEALVMENECAELVTYLGGDIEKLLGNGDQYRIDFNDRSFVGGIAQVHALLGLMRATVECM